MQFLRMMLTWWHSYTLGTALFTWRRGRLVGTDLQGNRYYVDKKGDSINGKPRRWVVFNGDVEASRVPPDWHGWLHYTVDETPLDVAPAHRDWHKPHQMNQTGLPQAYQPAGKRAMQQTGLAPESVSVSAPMSGIAARFIRRMRSMWQGWRGRPQAESARQEQPQAEPTPHVSSARMKSAPDQANYRAWKPE